MISENISNNGSSTALPSDGLCDETDVYAWYNCVIGLYAPVSVIVDKYITPLWYLVGILGNSLILKVWLCRIKRGSVVTRYLTVLAMSDLLLLLLHILVELKFAWNISTIDAQGWCQIIFVFFMLTQYMSPLLIVGFTLERFISIAMPFKSERFSKRNRAPVEISVITVIAFGLSIPQVTGWSYTDNVCQGSGSSFYSKWTWFSDILIFCILPIVSLLLNVLVVIFARRSLHERKLTAPMCKNGGSASCGQIKSNLRISTVTLLWVSFYRIFTVLPVAIIFALQFEIPYGDTTIPVSNMKNDATWRTYFAYVTAKKIIDEIGLTQYSCNVFIYMATVKHFRNDVYRLFRKLWSLSRRDSLEMEIIRNTSNTNMSRSTYITRHGTSYTSINGNGST